MSTMAQEAYLRYIWENTENEYQHEFKIIL